MRFVIFCPCTDKIYQQRLKNKNTPLGEVDGHTKGKAASRNIVSADIAIIIFECSGSVPLGCALSGAIVRLALKYNSDVTLFDITTSLNH